VQVDYAVTCFLFASQTKEGALSANLDEATRGDLIAQYNDEYAFVVAGDGVVHAGNYNFQIIFPKPLLVQKGQLRLYTATGGTVPANNYITCHVTYELAKVSPTQLASLLSGAID